MDSLVDTPRSSASREPLHIIRRGTDDPAAYEKARTARLFNGRVPEKYPNAICFVKDELDICEAMELAITNNLRVSVRAGGHSYAAWSLCDDALLLDLGGYSELATDEESGIVRLSPSTTGIELDKYLVATGRCFPGGHCPDVAMGGFLLGGGMGWGTNNSGWACEFVVAVDVVTADGRLVRANASRNEDLFWAARGGGPTFPGVVTRFYLETRPAPKVLRSSVYVFPVVHYRAAMKWAITLASTLSSVELTVIGSFQDGIAHACTTISLLATGDDEETVKDMLRLAHDTRPHGAISASSCQPTTVQREYANKAKAYPTGKRYKVDNVFLHDDADVVSLLETCFTTLPTRRSLALWTWMRPRSTKPLGGMALSMCSDHYLAVYAIWDDVADDARCGTWLATAMDTLEPHAVGSYLGEFDFDARPSQCWGERERQRLLRIKRAWDPDDRICTVDALQLGRSAWREQQLSRR